MSDKSHESLECKSRISNSVSKILKTFWIYGHMEGTIRAIWMLGFLTNWRKKSIGECLKMTTRTHSDSK